MKHRHLDYPETTEVAALPSAAIADLLDRGDLADWRPLLVEIAHDPDGDLAARVLALVDRFPMYGTSPLLRAWIDRSSAAARVGGFAPRTAKLGELRRNAGLTQTRLAGRLEMSQSDLSKLERRSDVRVSTLRAYVRALGGRLHLLAAFPDRTVRITLSETSSRSRRRSRT